MNLPGNAASIGNNTKTKLHQALKESRGITVLATALGFAKMYLIQQIIFFIS